MLERVQASACLRHEQREQGQQDDGLFPVSSQGFLSSAGEGMVTDPVSGGGLDQGFLPALLPHAGIVHTN